MDKINKILVVLLLLSFSICGYGQTYRIVETGTRTITRTDNVRKFTYYQMDDTTGVFIAIPFVSGGPTSTLEHKIIGYDVTDFALRGGRIYVTGRKISNNKAFYGWAPLTGVNAWKFNIKTFGGVSRSVDSLRSIQVFEDGGDWHVLLFGSVSHIRFTNIVTYESLIHVKNDNECRYRYAGPEIYDDATITDEYVVIATRKNNLSQSERCPVWIRLARRSGFSLYDTLLDSVYEGDRYMDSMAVGRAKVQFLGSDKFVEVHATGSASYEVRPFQFSILPTPIEYILNVPKFYIIGTQGAPEIIELAYQGDGSNDGIAVLHKDATGSWMTQFSCMTYPWLTISSVCKPRAINMGSVPVDLQSVDKMDTNGFVVSGLHSGHCAIWRTTSCKITTQRYMSSYEHDVKGKLSAPSVGTLLIINEDQLDRQYRMIEHTEDCGFKEGEELDEEKE